jgi:hypothetical protein
MSTQSIRMLDDPSEPNYVRELLQAGTDDVVTGYDYEKGLALHLGHISAGTPTPPWAQSLAQGAKVGAGISAKMAAVWLAVPLASAGIVAAVLLTGNQTPHVTSTKLQPMTGQVSGNQTVDEPQAIQAVATQDQTRPAERDMITAVEPDRAQLREPRSFYVPRHGRRPAESYHARHAGKFEVTAAAETPAFAATQSTRPARLETPAIAKETEPNQTSADTATRAEVWEAPAPVQEKAQENTKITFTPEPVVPVVQEQKPAEPKLTPLEREMRLLAAANRSLHSDPERTLALTQGSEKEFPNGMFAEERRELLVLSLVKLGHMEEARRLGLNYLHRYPNGPFSERVRRALATGQIPEE